MCEKIFKDWRSWEEGEGHWTIIVCIVMILVGHFDAESNFCSLDFNPIGDRGTVALAESMKTMNLQTLQ